MTIHIDYDREENKIESILASQSNVIRTLDKFFLYSNRMYQFFCLLILRCPIFKILAFMNYNIYDMSFPNIVYLLTYRKEKFVKLILRAYCKKREI